MQKRFNGQFKFNNQIFVGYLTRDGILVEESPEIECFSERIQIPLSEQASAVILDKKVTLIRENNSIQDLNFANITKN